MSTILSLVAGSSGLLRSPRQVGAVVSRRRRKLLGAANWVARVEPLPSFRPATSGRSRSPGRTDGDWNRSAFPLAPTTAPAVATAAPIRPRHWWIGGSVPLSRAAVRWLAGALRQPAAFASARCDCGRPQRRTCRQGTERPSLLRETRRVSAGPPPAPISALRSAGRRAAARKGWRWSAPSTPDR